jgi:hypothetical protein
MKQITEQQIRDRANEIGSRPIYPTAGKPWNGGKIFKVAPSEGMTYKMWLIGKSITGPNFHLPGLSDSIECILYYIAKAELEAEQEVQGE